jgi:hypothetical protein
MVMQRETIIRPDQIERYIRTDFFVDEQVVQPVYRYKDSSPNVAIIFLKASEIEPRSNDREDRVSRTMFEGLPAKEIDPALVLETILRVQRGAREAQSYIEQALHQPRASFTGYLLNQTVILERSPVVAETLGHLLRGATYVTVGTFLGASISPNPLVAFITVPAGIIVMGAATGIGLGLQSGLRNFVANGIGNLFKAPPRRRRRSTRTTAKKRKPARSPRKAG